MERCINLYLHYVSHQQLYKVCMKFYDSVKSKLKEDPSVSAKEMLVLLRTSFQCCSGNGWWSISPKLCTCLEEKQWFLSVPRATLENFCFILLHLLVPEIVIRYSEIPFSLLEDRVKVDGPNLPLFWKLMPKIHSSVMGFRGGATCLGP